jgi:hypothetical protein
MVLGYELEERWKVVTSVTVGVAEVPFKRPKCHIKGRSAIFEAEVPYSRPKCHIRGRSAIFEAEEPY